MKKWNPDRQSSGALGDITLAVSTQWHAFPKRFEWIASNGFAMAYTPEARQLQRTREHVTPYLEMGVPLRYHGYFPGFEIGDADRRKAEEALHLHMRAIDAIGGLGEQVMTVHIGLVPKIELSNEHIRKNFSLLVEYAGKKGVSICLENLRTGFASNPEVVVELAEKCGSRITMDVGHAVSCERVASGEVTVVGMVNMFSHLLEEVHFYEYETDNHYAPSDMSILGPIVDVLRETDCTWWTIELDSCADILKTRRLVEEYALGRKFVAAA